MMLLLPASRASATGRKGTMSLPLVRASRSFSPQNSKTQQTIYLTAPQLIYKQCIIPEGQGGISIALVADSATNLEYVVKTSPLSLETEYKIQSSLRSPHIAKTAGYYYDGKYHIVMEYCQRLDLFTYLEDKDLMEGEAKRLFKQLVDAIDTCHRARVVHLDIKPENCFIDAAGVLKLGDFGFAKVMKDGELVQDYCGTLEYMSPEVHQKLPFEGQKADIFAAGKILFELALGFTPFKKATFSDGNFKLFVTDPETYWQAKERVLRERGCIVNWNPHLLDLIQWMLSLHAGGRPTIEEIKHHSWMRD